MGGSALHARCRLRCSPSGEASGEASRSDAPSPSLGGSMLRRDLIVVVDNQRRGDTAGDQTDHEGQPKHEQARFR